MGTQTTIFDALKKHKEGDERRKLDAVLYARGTEDERREQLETCIEYVVKDLGLTEHDYSPLIDADNRSALGDSSEAIGVIYDPPLPETDAIDHVLDSVRDGFLQDYFIATRLDSISPGWRDVADIVTRLNCHGVTVIAVRDQVVIEPEDDRARDVLQAVADRDRRQAGTIKRHIEVNQPSRKGGRPPIGYEADGRGGIKPANEYDDIRSALKKVDDGEMTPYRAAQVTGHSRSAIRAAIRKRRELYRLD